MSFILLFKMLSSSRSLQSEYNIIREIVTYSLVILDPSPYPVSPGEYPPEWLLENICFVFFIHNLFVIDTIICVDCTMG